MNVTDLTILDGGTPFGGDFAAPPILQAGIALGSLAYFSYPLVADKVGAAAGGIFSTLYSCGQGMYNACSKATPQPIKKAVDLTGSALFQGIVLLDEMTDFCNFGGTKDPLASIEQSYGRLSGHDEDFAACCDFLADQIAGAYLKQEGAVRQSVSTKVKQWLPDTGAGIIDWFLTLSRDLIVQTIKANVMHLIANLADQGFDPDYEFGERQSNPLGRIISILGMPFFDHERELEELETLPQDTREQRRKELFQTISRDLLGKIFPKGPQDIQLFHHTIPVKWIKEKIWGVLQEKLPPVLERLYLETRPLSETHPDWEMQFDQEAQGLKASQLRNLPATLIRSVVLKDSGTLLKDKAPSLEAALRAKGATDPHRLSNAIIGCILDLLGSRNEQVSRMGDFVQSYFMERILFNLSTCTPDLIDDPMPLYLVRKWISGDVMKVFRECLSGNKELAKRSMDGALRDLLSPFGLDRKGAFPLPPMIKDRAWAHIQNIQSKFPQLLLKALPKWTALSDYQKGGRDFAWLNDPSCVQSCRTRADLLLREKIDQFAHGKESPLAGLNGLTQQQKLDLGDQISDFLKSPEKDILQEFALDCAQAFLLQMGKDIYGQYDADTAMVSLSSLFEDALPQQADTFIDWILGEGENALDGLFPARFTDLEKEALKSAMQAFHQLSLVKDAQQKKMHQDQFDQSWARIEGKFQRASKKLLAVCGYHTAQDLPFPSVLNETVWTKLQNLLPKKLFETSGWMLQTLLDKEELKEGVEALAHGDLLSKGCAVLAQDIVDNMPEWIEEKVTDLEKGFNPLEFGIDMADGTKQSMLDNARLFLLQKDPSYDRIWDMVELYLEAMFLKLTLQLSNIGEGEWDKLSALLENAGKQLSRLEEELPLEERKALDDEAVLDDEAEVEEVFSSERDVMLHLADNALKIIGMNEKEPLFGIPLPIQQAALAQGKIKVAEALLDIYHLASAVRNPALPPPIAEQVLPLPWMENVLKDFTAKLLDKVTDDLSTREADGQLELTSKWTPIIVKWLDQQSEKGYELPALLQEAIDQEVPFPYLEKLVDLLDRAKTKEVKKIAAEWINPFLTQQFASYLAPLLERENDPAADFDYSLLSSLLTVITSHFKNIRGALELKGELNQNNFLEVAGKVHPAARADADDEKVRFYQQQAELIFQAIFPNGKEDFIKIVPEGRLTTEQADHLWDAAQEVLVSYLPKAIEAIFNQEYMTAWFQELFDEVIEDLEQPVDPNQKAVRQGSPLIPEENSKSEKLDGQLGDFILEIARFLELPVPNASKLPWMVNKLIGGQGIEKKMSVAVGGAVRQKIENGFVQKAVLQGFKRLEKKKFSQKTKVEQAAAKEQAPARLEASERKLAEIILERGLQSASANLRKSMEAFDYPILKQVIDVVAAVSAFILSRLIAPILRFLKIDQWVVNILYETIHRATEKSIHVFSKSDIHQDLVFSGIEAVEKILIATPQQQA